MSVLAEPEVAAPRGSRGIDELLGAARARLTRLDAAEARAAAAAGAVLVDIRPEAQRRRSGTIPGALVVERNVLEWRFDPRSPARFVEHARYDARVVVVCQQGYTSSLAAVALHDLGLSRATDLVGGFEAWRDAGFAVSSDAG